ncbi:MAG: DUF4160 domain-containing protein, partial [Bacteroidota bacterium]
SGVKIQLFFKDHAPPHFHTSIAEFKAIISIEDGGILEGELPKNKKKEILSWAAENKEILMEIWNELN